MLNRIGLAVGISFFVVAAARSQAPKNQEEALAQLAKVEGKATFDPEHPKRVIAVNL